MLVDTLGLTTLGNSAVAALALSALEALEPFAAVVVTEDSSIGEGEERAGLAKPVDAIEDDALVIGGALLVAAFLW